MSAEKIEYAAWQFTWNAPHEIVLKDATGVVTYLNGKQAIDAANKLNEHASLEAEVKRLRDKNADLARELEHLVSRVEWVAQQEADSGVRRWWEASLHGPKAVLSKSSPAAQPEARAS